MSTLAVQVTQLWLNFSCHFCCYFFLQSHFIIELIELQFLSWLFFRTFSVPLPLHKVIANQKEMICLQLKLLGEVLTSLDSCRKQVLEKSEWREKSIEFSQASLKLDSCIAVTHLPRQPSCPDFRMTQ